MLSTLRTIIQEVNAAEGLDRVLAIIVRRVRDAMGTEVCSIYLRDEGDGRLVFRATEGLNPEQVGQVSLAANEGLVGLVADREEPLNLENADTHPRFHPVPGIGEESFRSFLGAPIIHQRQVLGVLVVQQKERRRFDEGDEAFLTTMAAQLAAAIAHARVTGSVQSARQAASDTRAGTLIKGIPGAPGIAIGQVVVVSPEADLYAVPPRKAADRVAELRAFKKALLAVRADIDQVAEQIGSQLPPEERGLFDAYRKILDDATIGAQVASRIKAGEWAQGALSQVMIEHIQHFERMEHSYLRERAVDVKDLGTRVLARLQAAGKGERRYPARAILVGEALTASVLGAVPRENLAGIISVTGSSNSHVAILARALGVPTVMGAVNLPYIMLEDQELIIDGYNGEVHLNPSSEFRSRFEAMQAEDAALSVDLESLRDLPCETLDGTAVPLWVNTGLMADVARSLVEGAEGVGLFRTEVPFLLRDRFPSEEEQRRIYRDQLELFAPKPVTMRTLDIGGDKSLPYFPIEEENPFLGWRGIRVTLDHPEIFLVQTRAMLRASEGLGNLRIMLPMVSHLGELDEALGFVRRAHRELVEDGRDIAMPPIGVMVEVPAAVYQASALAQRADFLSVGSNDLTQYLLAVDRNNSRVAYLYHSFHPAVLRALQDVAAAAQAEGTPVSICGELAGDPGAAVLLLGMGYGALSMSAANLPKVKKALRSISVKEAKSVLRDVMTLDSAAAVQARLEQFLQDKNLPGSAHASLS